MKTAAKMIYLTPAVSMFDVAVASMSNFIGACMVYLAPGCGFGCGYKSRAHYEGLVYQVRKIHLQAAAKGPNTKHTASRAYYHCAKEFRCFLQRHNFWLFHTGKFTAH